MLLCSRDNDPSLHTDQQVFSELLHALPPLANGILSCPTCCLPLLKRVSIPASSKAFSCGSLAPRMRKGAKRGCGCMDSVFARDHQHWEFSDGCVYLLRWRLLFPFAGHPLLVLSSGSLTHPSTNLCSPAESCAQSARRTPWSLSLSCSVWFVTSFGTSSGVCVSFC